MAFKWGRTRSNQIKNAFLFLIERMVSVCVFASVYVCFSFV